DPVSQTTLSDLEVIHEEGVSSELWSFAYPLADGSGEIVVATTRPETMLGDTAVAVHPDDARYKHLVGKTVRHPLVERHLPIIADAILVDPTFGTGVVKITPAHDFNDFEVGKRHRLEVINILNKDGTLNEQGGTFQGMDVKTARAAVKEKLEALGLARGSEPHKMNMGRSERSGAVAEPMLSTQWYVRTKPLATPSLAAVENGFTKFVPAQWENTYYAWLRDIRDWCISRQLWWGHRIPAWYCADCPHVTVARDTPEVCGGCGKASLQQEEDILDTWFSSALWPFSTQGWPEKTDALQRWYPTAVLITSFDIIFFWVARMMMFGQYFMGEVPFRDVYMHALIRDAEGEKMSKTKGNVVNPLQMIDKYGCDAFRFTLAAFAGQGRDVRWDEARAAGYHKFCNKIWQAFRFTMGNMPEGDVPRGGSRSVYDRWILGRLREAVTKVRAALDTYRFNDAAAAVYAFVWDELCDWYLEISKATLYSETAPEAQKNATREVLLEVFGTVARLMHPFMPFLSEELWQLLPGTQGSIMEQRYPSKEEFAEDAAAMAEAGFVADVIVAIRRVRAEFGVSPKERVKALVRGTPTQLGWLAQHTAVVQNLARADVSVLSAAAPKGAATEVVRGAEVLVPLAGLIDFDAERARLAKELGRIDKERERLSKQLGNADFVGRAPPEVVEEKRTLLSEAHDRIARLKDALGRLSA
ncbi:MAG TPA: valine--tRNA ligase, partial [Myxococcota bacterium]|nr:valine--tRNA ligase [Myxococcota bacterium]